MVRLFGRWAGFSLATSFVALALGAGCTVQRNECKRVARTVCWEACSYRYSYYYGYYPVCYPVCDDVCADEPAATDAGDAAGDAGTRADASDAPATSPACVSSRQCGEDETCRGERCVPFTLRACAEQRDCLAGERCSAGACTPSCRDEGDCPRGWSCDPSGVCGVAPAADAGQD